MRDIATLGALCAIAVTGCTSGCEGHTRPSTSVPSEAAASRDPLQKQKNTERTSELGFEIRWKQLEGYEVRGELGTIRSKYLHDAAVAVALPPDYESSPHTSYPLVIAFGGAGECAREPRRGALAWLEYYDTDHALVALKRNALDGRDFKGLVTPRQLASFNSRLKHSPFRGVIVACPSSPLISDEFPLQSSRYEAFIMEEVIPRLMARYRVTEGRIGIDGVSMGGARSMYYGLKHPEVFTSIGAVQGAFGRYFDTYRSLMSLNKAALSKRTIQLVTSDRDGLAPTVARMHDLLAQQGIEHTFLTLTGPHDYIFNQGPGVLSLLMFHDEALWREYLDR